MQSLEKSIDRPVIGRPARAGHSEHRPPWARMAALGLAIWFASGPVGCGGGAGPSSPERKEKQETVQNKMKDFMKQSRLPNRPR